MWTRVVRKTFKKHKVVKRSKNVFKIDQKKFSTTPFPNRPGYGLGSWIPPLVVKGMKEEAKYRSGIVVLNQIETDMDSVMREMLLEKNQMENSVDGSQTLQLTPQLERSLQTNIKKMSDNKGKILNEKFRMYMELFDVQERLMLQAIGSNSNDPNPNKNRAEESLSFFNTGIQSAVDFERSKIVHLPRAFDSITVNAHFFTKDESDETGSTHNMNVVGAVKNTGQKWFGSSTGQLAAAVSNSMTRTSSTHDIESTLLVSAYALHSKVRQFSPLVINPDLLLSAWNHYQPQQKIILDKISNEDLTENDDKLKEATIDLFAECFLGSAMIGLVHFIQTESSISMQGTSKQSLQAMQSVRSSSFLSGITGDTGLAIEMAQKAASALSSSGFDVRFDLVCLGYLPTIKSNTVQLAIKEFKDFDPAKFSVDNSQENYADLDALSNHLLNKSKDQATKQSNMGSVIRSTLLSLSENQEKTYSVLDYQTFTNAFDDYVRNASIKEGVGVPIGMNLKSFTKRDVIVELSKKYFPSSVANMGNPAANAQSAASSQASNAQASSASSGGDQSGGGASGGASSGGGDQSGAGASGGASGGGDQSSAGASGGAQADNTSQQQ